MKKYIFVFLIIVLGISFASNAHAAEVKIVQGCSSGQFIRYTDCDSGKAISRSSLAPGKNRFALNTDGKGFKVLISGGAGVYKVTAKLSTGEEFYVADYPANGKAVTLTADAKNKGWTSSGVEIFMPKEIQSNFPIKELGGCKNEADCKAYCDNQQNILACTTYGEKNGFLTKEQADMSKKFADVLNGEGPGACKDKNSCETFCNDIKNIDSCLSFAEKHDLLSADVLKEAKQVASALKAGATLPGGCTDENSCSNYCASSSHAEECLGFAEKAGFVSAADAELARKVLPLISAGQSPGKCQTKAECEKYCDNNSNLDECLTFAEKTGLISAEDAAMARKTGGKGPGGCTSKDACATFCNAPENQESCFQFAKDHDIIPADKLKEIEDGMGRLRSGLDQSPQEVIQCLKDNFGDNVIGEIESGKFMPGPEMGAKIKDCFDKNMGKMVAQLKSALDTATPETTACLQKELKPDDLEKIKAGGTPTPEQGDVFRKCFETMRVEGMQQLKNGLKQMPPEARTCIENAIGKDKVAAIENGEDVQVGPEVATAMQKCGNEIESSMLKMMDDQLSKAPPEIQDCIKSKITDDFKNKLKSGSVGPEAVSAIVTGCMANFKPQMPGNIPEGSGAGSIPKATDFIPTGSFGPSSGGTTATPPPDLAPTAEMCKNFAAAPSCAYVPESVRALCEKCKNQ